MVDTNSDPREVDFVIPSNDDATKSIGKIVSLMVDAVQEGLQERRSEKDPKNKQKQRELLMQLLLFMKKKPLVLRKPTNKLQLPMMKPKSMIVKKNN